MTADFDFSGKTVFVAGGTSGINLGIAESFADRGARLVVASRSQDKVDAAVAKLRGHGADSYGFSADVRDFGRLAEAFAAAHETCGDIDVLISGAAGNFPVYAENLSSNGFKTVVDIDLIGTFNVLKAAFSYLCRPGASVINITAPQSEMVVSAQVHVCAAKAGIDQLTRVLALEWGKYGIRVNAISPGPIAGTEGMERLNPKSDSGHQALLRSIPLGRMGLPSDIGNMALFLSSPLGSYITGAVIPVDGGWVLNGGAPLSRALQVLLAETTRS